MSDWFIDALFYATEEERQWFDQVTAGLPVRDESEPYHCLAHTVRNFRRVHEWAKPVTVLEIGFNLGHSAAIWLGLGASVWSIEKRCSMRIARALDILSNRFGSSRISLVIGDSAKVELPAGWPRIYDLIFVDGGHELEDVRADIALGREMGVKHFLFDDWQPQFGPGVQPAIAEAKLLPLAVLGNMAYCVEPAATGYFPLATT